jgi:hypothetical protein
MESQNLLMTAALAVFVLVVFYNSLGLSLNGRIKDMIRPNEKPIIVDRFTVAMQIPDVEDKYEEGGFHLYFESPELNIKQLLAYSFDKNSIVKHGFDISDRALTYSKFKKIVPKMTIYSNSANVFNTSKVMLVAVLSNGDFISGEKQLDQTKNHNHHTPPILLDMKLN